MRIHSSGGSTQPGDGRDLETFVTRKGLLPGVPNAVFAERQFAIVLEAGAALPVNGAFPLWLQRRSFTGGFLPDDASQHIEVVHLAQNILELLQTRTPCFVFLRQQTLHGITKLLEPNAEPVPRGWLIRTQSFRVQVLGFVEALDSQALSGQTPGGDQANALAQPALQVLPPFRVEFAR